jgi:hypothetical protein
LIAWCLRGSSSHPATERSEGYDERDRQPDPDGKTDGDGHHDQPEGSRRHGARATQGGPSEREMTGRDGRRGAPSEPAVAADSWFVSAQQLRTGDEQQSDDSSRADDGDSGRNLSNGHEHHEWQRWHHGAF